MQKQSNFTLNNFILKDKKSIIMFLKGILLIFILFFIGRGLTSIPFTILVTVFFVLFIVLLIGSLIYFSFTQKKEDRRLLLTMWKIYLSVLTIMFILLFSTENNITKMKIDFQKTKLQYEIKIKSTNLESTFSTYESLVTKYTKPYENKKINNDKVIKPNKEKKEDYYISNYANFAMTVMIITSLFMCIWGLTELSIFQEVKKREINRSLKVYK